MQAERLCYSFEEQMPYSLSTFLLFTTHIYVLLYAKIKNFRSQLRGVKDKAYFLFRLSKIYA